MPVKIIDCHKVTSDYYANRTFDKQHQGHSSKNL